MSVAAEVDRYQRQLKEAETALDAQETYDDPGLERAKGDFRELSTALKAVERAERQFGGKESEYAARKVNTFLRELHDAASSMSARADELAQLTEIADELADRAVCGVYRWATWDVVLERVVEYVVPRSTGSPEGDGDPDADRTDVLQERFDALVAELGNEAASRLDDHAVAWREATEAEIAPLRAIWADDAFQCDVVGLLRRAFEKQPEKVELALRKIERALDACLSENVFDQALRDLARAVPQANRFPLRAKHLQPWAAPRAPGVSEDRVARHQAALLRMRVNVATAAAETVRDQPRFTGTRLVAGVKKPVEDVRTSVPRDVPARPRRPFDPRYREDPEPSPVEEGPVALLRKKWFAVLPVRGVLFALASTPTHAVAIQVLDGVGAGIFGALFPIMIADLTRGTGRDTLALGAATTMWGIGAALSTTLAGAVIVLGGYDLAFLTLAGIAVLALGLFALAVPETSPTGAVVSP